MEMGWKRGCRRDSKGLEKGKIKRITEETRRGYIRSFTPTPHIILSS
jgi:hypothetical protein